LLPITRRERENGATLRPVLGARKQLVFMSPRMVGNEPALYHPFRDRIQSLIDGVLPIFDLDRHLTDPNAAPPLPLVAPKLYAFPRLRLAGIRRWWKLSGGQYLDPRDLESFSSSEKFIFNPTAWVLRYKAKLWNGRLLGTDLVCGGRQRGNLLHRLFELVFASVPPIDWLNAKRLQMDLWLEKEWQNLLPMEGANLRLPGYKVIAEGLLDEGKRAIWVLIEHLRVAGVTKTSANVQTLEIPFVGGNIFGFLDLLVENASGQKAVIDLKYGGFKQKSQELSDNLHLQLAVYARLVDQGSPWPEAAFLILGKRALLAQQRNFFPDADIVSSKLSPSGLQACWNEFEELWKWRRDLLDQGWIECAVSGSDGATSDLLPNSTSPIQRWQLENYADPYDDLGVLTGWEDSA